MQVPAMQSWCGSSLSSAAHFWNSIKVWKQSWEIDSSETLDWQARTNAAAATDTTTNLS